MPSVILGRNKHVLGQTNRARRCTAEGAWTVLIPGFPSAWPSVPDSQLVNAGEFWTIVESARRVVDQLDDDGGESVAEALTARLAWYAGRRPTAMTPPSSPSWLATSPSRRTSGSPEMTMPSTRRGGRAHTPRRAAPATGGTWAGTSTSARQTRTDPPDSGDGYAERPARSAATGCRAGGCCY